MTMNNDLLAVLSKDAILKNARVIVINSKEAKRIDDYVVVDEMLDLSVAIVIFDDKGVTRLTSFMVDFFDINIEELKERAYKNTAKAGFNAKPMSKILGMLGFECDHKAPMVIGTNREFLYGAAIILYKQCISDIAEHIKNDLWIIPSSKHEVIILPYSEIEAARLIEMIQEVNRTEVRPEDWLGDYPYLYRRDEDVISEVFFGSNPCS